MDSFFARLAERWPPGRRDYHWHLLPDPGQVRERLWCPYRELTGRPGLAPVPPQWSHVTICHAAPVAAVTGREVADITALVREGCAEAAPFELTVRPAEVWGTGIVCPLWPGAPARRLWQIVTAAARAVTGDQFQPAVYHPHLALAYCFAAVEDGPLRVWLSDHRIPEMTFTADRLHLVAQWHDGHEITWQPVTTIALDTEDQS